MTTHLQAIEKWKNLPWTQFQRIKHKLQYKIYIAAKENDLESIKKWQIILINENSSRYLSVKQVTETDISKNIAGLNGQSRLSAIDKIILSEEIKNLSIAEYESLRDLIIVKVNGNKELLSVPNMKDRAIECLIKYALEPLYESYASSGSYAFRVGRNPWDIQKIIYDSFKVLEINSHKRILKIDLTKCLSEAHYNELLREVFLPQEAKSFLLSGIKAGIFNDYLRNSDSLYVQDRIAPILANILLNGIEDIWNSYNSHLGEEKSYASKSTRKQKGLRFGNKAIFIIESHEDPEDLINQLFQFLFLKGLNPYNLEFNLVPIVSGFDFLNWHFKVKAKNNKFVCYPSKTSCVYTKATIKNIMRNSRYKLEDRLAMVKIEYIKWRIYNQYCDMKQVKTRLWYLSKWTYKYGKKQISKQKKETRSASKEKLLSKVKDIFNGHKYQINGYIPNNILKYPYNMDL
uniref:Putative reverse transcriptase n=1 Tax=Porphyridium purpureum TaxID=35688 RepID=W0RZ48_PORPP|nr:putative reverse transcriptase [Porphyridium purpureum]BAO23660.1 putative reverse transcriptase [Porphyridium purpureum]